MSDIQSKRSLASEGGISKKRSKSAGKSLTGRKSVGLKSLKSKKSLTSKKSMGRYEKLKDADEVEMADLGRKQEDLDVLGLAPVAVQMGNNAIMRPHEIYADTSYIPNNQLRLMEIPITSSLFFQKLLFYHSTYDIVYGVFMIAGALHKMSIWSEHELVWPIISLVVQIVWVPFEYFRIRFGYKGNINETFSEIVAFLFASAFFVLPISGVALLSWLDEFRPPLPHEFTCIAINVAFLIAEIVTACVLMRRFC